MKLVFQSRYKKNKTPSELNNKHQLVAINEVVLVVQCLGCYSTTKGSFSLVRVHVHIYTHDVSLYLCAELCINNKIRARETNKCLIHLYDVEKSVASVCVPFAIIINFAFGATLKNASQEQKQQQETQYIYLYECINEMSIRSCFYAA